MRGGRGAGRLAAGLVAAAMLLGACSDAGTVTIAEFESQAEVAFPHATADAPTSRTDFVEWDEGSEDIGPPGADTSSASGEAAGPAVARMGWGDGLAAVTVADSLRPGEAAVHEVALYDGYAIVTLVDPPSGEVDRITLYAGRRPSVDPVRTHAGYDPAASTFARGEVAWDRIPELVERTPAQLGIAGGKVSHVLVARNLPFSPDTVIRVYVSSERRSGRIDYFADGRVMREFKD